MGFDMNQNPSVWPSQNIKVLAHTLVHYFSITQLEFDNITGYVEVTQLLASGVNDLYFYSHENKYLHKCTLFLSLQVQCRDTKYIFQVTKRNNSNC